MLFDIFKDGYLRKEPVSLTASDQEHVVTLDPELVISGSVTDAVTGKPVPRFRVIQGLDQPRRGRGPRGQEQHHVVAHGRGGIHRRSLLDEVRYAEEGVVRAHRGAWLRAGRIARLPPGRRRDDPGLPA